jgi:glyoxylate/hydroxypyruvate reductase A
VTINVVIGSYLEPELVERIESSDDELVVHYRPDLLPVPRYACDHSGPPRNLTSEQVEEWRRVAASADVFFDFDWFNPSMMAERSPNLKWIQGTSAGIGATLQRTGLDRTSIIVTTAGGIHAVPLSEFALMGALYFTKGVPFLNSQKAQHHWERYTTNQLRGRRALVVGLGGIGREMVRVFDAMGVEVTGLGRTGARYEVAGLTRVIERHELDDALPNVDILILCAPLTKETEGVIGARQLDLLGKDAIVINVGRGQLVDEEALTLALRTGALAGACLDVFVHEPLPTESALWELENVIISPHSESTVRTENRDLVELFIENMVHWRHGEPMRNLYDPVAGY